MKKYQFKNIIENMTISHDNIMVSFGVKSLYTSIPIEFAKCSVREAIENDPYIQIRASITNDELMELI